jgi:molybdenum cofactor cytidylyltransferase
LKEGGAVGKIWSIILAAGESKRMGSPKMLLPFNGSTILENVIHNVAGSAADGILVVLGANAEKICELVSIYGVLQCKNENFREGMLSSVKCGFRNLPGDMEAVLVFQGDQPCISAGTINSLIDAFHQSDKGIVLPVYKGKRGHPLLLDIKYSEEVERLDPDEGLRGVIRLHADDIQEVDTMESGILRDIDTLEDYILETKLKQ